MRAGTGPCQERSSDWEQLLCVAPGGGCRGCRTRGPQSRSPCGLSAPPLNSPPWAAGSLGTGSPPRTHLGLGFASGDPHELKEHGPSRPWPRGARAGPPGPFLRPHTPSCAPTPSQPASSGRLGLGSTLAAVSHTGHPDQEALGLEATALPSLAPSPILAAGSSAHGCGTPSLPPKLCL